MGNVIHGFRDILNSFNIYICSFCLSVDHLPAWQKYGNQSKGVAIGFRKEFFTPQKKKKGF